MTMNLRFVGLDVHKETIVVGVADSDSRPAEILGTLPHDVPRLIRRLQKLGPLESLRCCYEAGPTGYDLYRALRAAGISCVVVAPSLVPIQSGRRIKTDRRDARKLAHFLRSGDLTEVWVPDEATEAMRDLERARDDAKNAQRRARQQLGKFLLRHGRRFDQTRPWTVRHMNWVEKQKFAHEAQNRVLTDYLQTVREATARVERLTQDIAELVETWTLAPLVKQLQAFRGVQLVTAVVIAAELGELKRFKKPGQLMSFLGQVPSEFSSGDRRRQGRITRTGNGHVRRILTEAAWSYRFRPNMSQAIAKRNEHATPAVRAIAWKAQHRLHRRYQRMTHLGKDHRKVVAAVARELTGFLWAAGQEVDIKAQSQESVAASAWDPTPEEQARLGECSSSAPRPKPPLVKETTC